MPEWFLGVPVDILAALVTLGSNGKVLPRVRKCAKSVPLVSPKVSLVRAEYGA